jgi:hypothetical protein
MMKKQSLRISMIVSPLLILFCGCFQTPRPGPSPQTKHARIERLAAITDSPSKAWPASEPKSACFVA